MLTRNKAQAEELAGVRITRSRASVVQARVGVMEPELPNRVQRKRAARSVRGIVKDAEPAKNDGLAQEEAGDASMITKAETLEIPEDTKISQVVGKTKEAAAPDKSDVVRTSISPENVSFVSRAPVVIANPIPLAATLPLGPTFARPVRTRSRIDQSGVPFGGYIFLDLETNDAMKTPQETRILEIAICATNEKFEPLDAGFESLVHWPDMTAEQLRAEMPIKVKEMHKQLLAEYERTPADQRRDLEKVERLACKYLERHGIRAESREAIMSGAGIAFDRGTIREHMRELDSYFHFQICDISSLWHIVKRRYDRYIRYQNCVAHRAMADIQGSMREAKMYLDLVFKSPKEVQWPF